MPHAKATAAGGVRWSFATSEGLRPSLPPTTAAAGDITVRACIRAYIPSNKVGLHVG